jgi:uncharacterized membrane protein
MAFSHVLLGAGNVPAQVTVRHLKLSDLKDALVKGFDDFYAMPSYAIFLCGIYPIIGLILARLAFGYSILPLIYPLAMGFALIGPFAALGLYELSRRREKGEPISVTHAFDVVQSSSIGAIAVVGLLLVVIFGTWLAVANAIYVSAFGYAVPVSLEQFVTDVFTTPAGWYLMVVGNAVGFCFAAIALTVSVVSFPLLLDRDVGAAVALWTSIRVVAANLITVAAWGLVVALLLVLGSLPLFLGLAVVVPVLGHATWHLYRKAVIVEAGPRPERRQQSVRRYAADFPASLFPFGGNDERNTPTK